MKTYAKITSDTYYIGVNDRRTHLFEGMWPLPHGVSYNSYLIVDEKIALVDTVEISYSDRFIKQIKRIIGERPIDYLIINHMEPDHSGAIRFIKQYYPEITIVGNRKTFDMIKGFYNVASNQLVVNNGHELVLGKHTLNFQLIPMVHWPETMVTYDQTTKTLFSGDAFGCFGTLDGGIIDEDLNLDKYWGEMIRYYSNIVGKYAGPVQKALKKLEDIELDYICTTHGPVWHKEIPAVVKEYDRMSKYKAEPGVVIAYASMYGNTEELAEEIARELATQGVKNIIMHNVSVSHSSYIIADIFRYNGLIIGSTTYNGALYPEIESLLSKIKMRAVRPRHFGYFGSCSWANAAIKCITLFAEEHPMQIVNDPIELRQGMTEELLSEVKQLASSMANAINN
jgi:flavorubredoxin